MKTKLLLFALFAMLFVPGGMAVQAQSAGSKSSNPSARIASDQVCQCVDYFVYKLNNGQRVSGDWPTAASMAKQEYWDKTVHPRYRSQTAQAGDVVIMQDNAVVYPWRIVPPPGWDDYFKTHPIGYGAGHIGIVTKAEYWDDYGGWFITLQSANWSPAWGIQYSDAGCSNVSDSQVFIPNGDVVSFWRQK